ncbi:MAG: hypothetical protein MR581_00210 [Lachnospiraceae bacterium]|nr:hypothetical protein [Lachnospiraceae bacterium]
MLTTVVGVIFILSVSLLTAYEIYAFAAFRTRTEAECTEVRALTTGKGKHQKTTYRAVFSFLQGEEKKQSSLNREVGQKEFQVGNRYNIWIRSKHPAICVESRKKIGVTLAVLCLVEIGMIAFVMHMYSAADLANTLMHLS